MLVPRLSYLKYLKGVNSEQLHGKRLPLFVFLREAGGVQASKQRTGVVSYEPCGGEG